MSRKKNVSRNGIPENAQEILKKMHQRALANKTTDTVVYMCRNCGKGFEGNRHQKRVYCSAECRRGSGVGVPHKGRYFILERDGFQCFYCGKTSFGDREELHVDHVIPSCRGGKDRADNLVTSCGTCNMEKNGYPIHNPEKLIDEIRRRNLSVGIPDDACIRLSP